MNAQKKSAKQNKPWYKKWWGITLIVILALATLSAVAPEERVEKKPAPQASQQAQEKKQPKYEIKIAGSRYVDPVTRSLTFTVKNIGEVQGNPSCSVTLRNETDTYRGYDLVSWNTPVQPGEAKYFDGNFVITNEGAAYATKSEVRCVERSVN
jgi:hypothetical protein